MSAIFFTRSRMPAKSALASMPHGPCMIERARLVPIDAVGADDVVDEPALLVEAAHMRLAALIENGGNACCGRFMT